MARASTGPLTEIPTDAPERPQMTQCAVGIKELGRRDCQRRPPRGCFSEPQRKRDDMASRKVKTRCSNAARGLVLAKPCVGCRGDKPRDCFGGTRWEGRATGPKSLERPNNRWGKGSARGKMTGFKDVSETQLCSAATNDGGAGPPGSLAASLNRAQVRDEKEARSADGRSYRATQPSYRERPSPSRRTFHAWAAPSVPFRSKNDVWMDGRTWTPRRIRSGNHWRYDLRRTRQIETGSAA